MFVSIAFFSLNHCTNSSSQIEARLSELKSDLEKTICTKTIDCAKQEISKIPLAHRNMIPAFMQSESACLSFFKTKFEEAEKKQIEKNFKMTNAILDDYESCISALEKTSCEEYTGTTGQLKISGCENMKKYSL